MTPDTPEIAEQRKLYEAFVVDRADYQRGDLSRLPDGNYALFRVQGAWIGWLASYRANRPTEEDVERAAERILEAHRAEDYPLVIVSNGRQTGRAWRIALRYARAALGIEGETK